MVPEMDEFIIFSIKHGKCFIAGFGFRNNSFNHDDIIQHPWRINQLRLFDEPNFEYI